MAGMTLTVLAWLVGVIAASFACQLTARLVGTWAAVAVAGAAAFVCLNLPLVPATIGVLMGLGVSLYIVLWPTSTNSQNTRTS